MRVVTVSVEPGSLKAVVILGGTYEEVDGYKAKELAHQEAVKAGVPRAGLSDQSGVYPVDANGKSEEDVLTGKTPVAEYRQDFTYAGI